MNMNVCFVNVYKYSFELNTTSKLRKLNVNLED